MPKKTRSEKILARLRRLENSQIQINNNSVQTETNQGPKISYEISEPIKASTTSSTASANINYKYVYQDLSKSLLFAVVAVIFQVLLALFVF